MGTQDGQIRLQGEAWKVAEAHRRQYGVDIAVVDDSDFYGSLSSAFRIAEAKISDLKTMVAAVLARKLHYDIRRLDVIDHGNRLTFQIGSDSIGLHKQLAGTQGVMDLSEAAPELLKLKPHFKHWGFIHMQHCDIGQNKELMIALSKLVNVSIYAGTGNHRAYLRRQEGDYMRADPNGAYYKTSRPDQDTHSTYIGMRPEENHPIEGSREALTGSIRYTVREDYPPPTDYYLKNALTNAATVKTAGAHGRIVLELMNDFQKGVPNKSKLAKELFARLSKKVANDNISVLFHRNLNQAERAGLLEVLQSKQ